MSVIWTYPFLAQSVNDVCLFNTDMTPGCGRWLVAGVQSRCGGNSAIDLFRFRPRGRLSKSGVSSLGSTQARMRSALILTTKSW